MNKSNSFRTELKKGDLLETIAGFDIFIGNRVMTVGKGELLNVMYNGHDKVHFTLSKDDVLCIKSR